MSDLGQIQSWTDSDVFTHDFDVEEGEYVGELAQQSIGNFDKTVTLLRFNNHTIHKNYIDSFFNCFRCPCCDIFIKKFQFPNIHLSRCKDRVRHYYSKNMYERRETLFEKQEGFNFSVSEDKKHFKNLAIFDFDSVSVPTEETKNYKVQLGLENMFQLQSLEHQI